MIRLIALTGLLQLPLAVAGLPAELPDPLSLQQAIQLAEDPEHYQLLEARASITRAESVIERQSISNGFNAQLELQGAYIEPSRIALDQSSNDSSATLRLSKPIYDFSGGQQKIEAANIEFQALQENMSVIIGQRKIDIARLFFDVILADLKYAWDNEDMAIAFVRFDADKDRYALSQMSDVDFLESETRYLDTLHKRTISESEQRHTRALLAESLNRADQLPSNLKMPALSFPDAPLPEFSILIEKVQANNPHIKLAEQRLEAANQEMDASGRQFYPRLDAQLEMSEYARISGSKDEWRAEINMVIPLYENSSIKADVAEARANLLQQRAQLLHTRQQVRQQALKLWQSISILSKRKKQLQTTQAFRELKLDKSRALYEMEVKTDLGDSMIAISQLQYLQARNDFELMLAWMQLRLLAGETDLFQASL